MLTTRKEQILNSIKTLGIMPDDTVLLHSALYRFGKLDFTSDELLETLINYLDHGHLILPAFTYSYRRNEIFDQIKSMPDKRLGILSKEAFRIAHIRNSCPQFSFVTFKKSLSKLLQVQSDQCFGRGSVFDKMCDINVKILSLGVDFSSGLTMFINFEKLANVPYRNDLCLYGRSILNNGKIVNSRTIHFAYDDINFSHYVIDRSQVGERLIKRGICKEVYVSKVPIYAIRVDDLRDYVTELLLRDPLVMMKRKENV